MALNEEGRKKSGSSFSLPLPSRCIFLFTFLCTFQSIWTLRRGFSPCKMASSILGEGKSSVDEVVQLASNSKQTSKFCDNTMTCKRVNCNYSWTPLQRPPWGQKKVTIVERLKQVWMYSPSRLGNEYLGGLTLRIIPTYFLHWKNLYLDFPKIYSTIADLQQN